GAGGGLARCPRGPALARARLALAVGAAGRHVLHRADAGRIDRAGRDVRADTQHGRDARLARAGARLIAADALGAEGALALVRGRAHRAVFLLPARVRGAAVRRQALRVVGAGVEAARSVAD